MIRKNHRNLLGKSPAVVGTIHSVAAMEAALRLRKGAVDLLELRVDALLEDQESILRRLPRLRFPLLLTVRERSEGGCAKLSPAQRIAHYERFIDSAALVDVELRSLKSPLFKRFVQSARDQGRLVVCSFHDFKKTPSQNQLHLLAAKALEAGADIFKVAARTNTPSDLSRLLAFLSKEQRLPLAVMGMGPMGKISRLLLAQCGSVLNYGFLDKPQVPGQWSATLLKERLKELGHQQGR